MLFLSATEATEDTEKRDWVSVFGVFRGSLPRPTARASSRRARQFLVDRFGLSVFLQRRRRQHVLATFDLVLHALDEVSDLGATGTQRLVRHFNPERPRVGEPHPLIVAHR